MLPNFNVVHKIALALRLNKSFLRGCQEFHLAGSLKVRTLSYVRFYILIKIFPSLDLEHLSHEKKVNEVPIRRRIMTGEKIDYTRFETAGSFLTVKMLDPKAKSLGSQCEVLSQ